MWRCCEGALAKHKVVKIHLASKNVRSTGEKERKKERKKERRRNSTPPPKSTTATDKNKSKNKNSQAWLQISSPATPSTRVGIGGSVGRSGVADLLLGQAAVAHHTRREEGRVMRRVQRKEKLAEAKQVGAKNVSKGQTAGSDP